MGRNQPKVTVNRSVIHCNVIEGGWGSELSCVHLKMGSCAHVTMLSTGSGIPISFLPHGSYPNSLALWLRIHSLVSEASMDL